MRWMTLIMGIMLAGLLAACDTATTNTLPTTAPTLPPAAPTQEILDTGGSQGDDLSLGEAGDGLFTATITGSVSLTLAGPGSYACEGGTEFVRVQTADGQLNMAIPPDTAPGEYTLGTGEEGIGATLELGSDVYSQDIFGIVTLESTPSAAGDPVSGSFDLNFTSADGDSVNAVGSFSLTAGGVC